MFLEGGEKHLLSFITGRGDIPSNEDQHPAYVLVGIVLCSPSKYQGRDAWEKKLFIPKTAQIALAISQSGCVCSSQMKM